GGGRRSGGRRSRRLSFLQLLEPILGSLDRVPLLLDLCFQLLTAARNVGQFAGLRLPQLCLQRRNALVARRDLGAKLILFPLQLRNSGTQEQSPGNVVHIAAVAERQAHLGVVVHVVERTLGGRFRALLQLRSVNAERDATPVADHAGIPVPAVVLR